MFNPLSRREVLRFGAFTTVGGVLTPGISLAQAIVTDTNGIVARDIQLTVGGTSIPAYDARPEKAGRYPIIVVISGFTGNNEHNKDVVRRFAQAGFHGRASWAGSSVVEHSTFNRMVVSSILTGPTNLPPQRSVGMCNGRPPSIMKFSEIISNQSTTGLRVSMWW